MHMQIQVHSAYRGHGYIVYAQTWVTPGVQSHPGAAQEPGIIFL